MTWREKIDPSIKNHLEAQINQTIRHKESYSKADRPSEAQLWVAIANLSKQIFDLNLRLKFLEQVMQETIGRRGSVVLQKSEEDIPKTTKKKATKRKTTKKK